MKGARKGPLLAVLSTSPNLCQRRGIWQNASTAFRWHWVCRCRKTVAQFQLATRSASFAGAISPAGYLTTRYSVAEMPFKSQAQRRKFAQLLVEGKISNETFEEWNRETGSKKLPERVSRKMKTTTRRNRATGRKRR